MVGAGRGQCSVRQRIGCHGASIGRPGGGAPGVRSLGCAGDFGHARRPGSRCEPASRANRGGPLGPKGLPNRPPRGTMGASRRPVRRRARPIPPRPDPRDDPRHPPGGGRRSFGPRGGPRRRPDQPPASSTARPSSAISSTARGSALAAGCGGRAASRPSSPTWRTPCPAPHPPARHPPAAPADPTAPRRTPGRGPRALGAPRRRARSAGRRGRRGGRLGGLPLVVLRSGRSRPLSPRAWDAAACVVVTSAAAPAVGALIEGGRLPRRHQVLLADEGARPTSRPRWPPGPSTWSPSPRGPTGWPSGWPMPPVRWPGSAAWSG